MAMTPSERKQKQRDKKRDINVTISHENVTSEKRDINVTYFKDGIEMVYAFGSLPDRPRYHTLHDGQVLDRTNQRFLGLSDGSMYIDETLPERRDDRVKAIA